MLAHHRDIFLEFQRESTHGSNFVLPLCEMTGHVIFYFYQCMSYRGIERNPTTKIIFRTLSGFSRCLIESLSQQVFFHRALRVSLNRSQYFVYTMSSRANPDCLAACQKRHYQTGFGAIITKSVKSDGMSSIRRESFKPVGQSETCYRISETSNCRVKRVDLMQKFYASINHIASVIG